jgi:hypothetical protein
MAEGTPDFYLSFGSDANPFSRQISQDLEPGITKINELREALAAYERQAADSKKGSSPLGLSFENLDSAAERIESATKDFSTKFNGIVEKITGVADQLEAAMRVINRSGVGGRPPVRPPAPPAGPPGNIVPVTGTRPRNTTPLNQLDPGVQARLNELDRQKRAGLTAITDEESARSARGKAQRTTTANELLTQANTKIAKTMGTLTGHLEKLDTLLKAVTDNKPPKKTTGEDDSAERRLNNVSSEVQVGNTSSNPIPVIIVGGDPAVAGHPHPAAHGHTPAARTATADAKTQETVAVAQEVVNAAPGTKKNPRALLPDERPYSPDEWVYPFGGDPKGQATRAFGLRSGENFGQYSKRVDAVRSRVDQALGQVEQLSPEDAEELRLYKLSGRPVPKARSSALGMDRNGSYLPIQSARGSATPADIDPLVGEIVAKRDEVFRQQGNVAHSSMLQELLRDPRLTQDGLSREAKSALSQIDKIMLNPEQGLGRGDVGQDQRVLRALFGNRHNFNEDDTRHFLEGATRRAYIRDNGSAAWTRSMDERENGKVLSAASAQNDWQYEETERQAEVDQQKNSVEGRNARREAAVKTAGSRYRSAQGFINMLEGKESFRDPARELVRQGAITEGEYPLAALRTPASNFNTKSLPDVEKAEQMLRAQIAPVVNGLRDQLKRVRRPDKIGAINEQLESLTLRTKTPSEMQYEEVNKDFLAAKKALTAMDQGLLGHGETIPEIEFDKSGKAFPKKGNTASPEYLAAAEYKNEMTKRLNEAHANLQPFGLSARTEEMKRVAQVLANMHQETLLGAVSTPRAEAEPETPLARPTASVDETQAAGYYEGLGRKQLRKLVDSGSEEAAGELKRRQLASITKEKKDAEREAKKAARDAMDQQLRAAAAGTSPGEINRDYLSLSSEDLLEAHGAGDTNATAEIARRISNRDAKLAAAGKTAKTTAGRRRSSRAKNPRATEAPSLTTAKAEADAVDRLQQEIQPDVVVEQIDKAIHDINRKISDQTRAVEKASKTGAEVPQFDQTVAELKSLKEALREQRRLHNRTKEDLAKAQAQLAELQAEEEGGSKSEPKKRRSARSSATSSSAKAASAASAKEPTPEMLVEMGLITEGEAAQLAELQRVKASSRRRGGASVTEPQAKTTKEDVGAANDKLSAANTQYAETLNEELVAVRAAIRQGQNEIRNLRRRQARGTAGGYANDDELGGSLAALQDERDRLKAELRDVLSGKKLPAGGGGNGNKPPTPPAPPAGSNPEPEEPESNDRLIPTTGRAVNSDLQKRLAALSPETQRALETARQSILNPLSSEDTEATRHLQREALVRAAAAFKSDPAMSGLFKDVGDRARSFGQAVGLDINRRGVRGLIREDLFPAGEQRMHANRLANMAESEGGAGTAEAQSRARLDEIMTTASGRLREARLQEYIAEERLAAVRANGEAGTLAEARAELQLAVASRNVATAQMAASREDQLKNGNAWQRATGRPTANFGRDLMRHGTYALENTIGYTLVFTGFEKLREVVHTGIEADAAFVRLQASLDANGISAGNLTTKLAQISATTATPLEHVIEAASELAGTFKNSGDIAFATNIAAQLANISQGTLTAKEAAVGLRDVVSAFGQAYVTSGGQARQFIQQTGDQIAHLSQLTGVSIKDITEGTTQIAQEASEFGLNQRQSATLAAYVTQGTGESGEQAASQTSRMLATLYNGRTQQALVKLKLATPEDFANGDVGKVLTNLISKWDTLNAESKQTVASLMGTGIQARAFAALMKGGAAAVAELNGSMDDTGALAKQNQAYLNTVAGAIKQLSEDFQNLGMTLAHLGAFDAIGILANALDKLFKEFNKVFGGIAAIMNSNPLTATLMHYTTLILEAAAAWRLFGAMATTALVKTGAVSAAQVGVGLRNGSEIATATTAAEAGALGAASIPGAKYERARFGTLAGALFGNARGRAAGMWRETPVAEGEIAATPLLKRDVRSFLPGAMSAGTVIATKEAAATAAVEQRILAERTLAEAEARENVLKREGAATQEALARASQEVIAAFEGLVAASEAAATAEAEAGAARLAGAGAGQLGTLGALGSKLNGSTLLKLGVGIGAFMFATDQMGKSREFGKQRSEADKALENGSLSSAVYAKTQDETGAAGFRDYYLGTGSWYSQLGNAGKHTGESLINTIANPLSLIGVGPKVFGGGGGGVSDASNKKFFALNDEIFNKGVVKDLPKLKTNAAVKKWLADEEKEIDKHAKDIKNAGGNDANAKAQMEYSLNQLRHTLTTAASNRLASIAGLKSIDRLNSQQSATAAAAAAQLAKTSKLVLKTPEGRAAAEEIIADTGVAKGSSEYKSLQQLGNPSATHEQRLKAQLTADQVNLKSVISRLGTVGNKGGVAIGSPEYQQLVQTRDQLLDSIGSTLQEQQQEPIQLAQNIAQLRTSVGNTAGAATALRQAITDLQNTNKNLDASDPQYWANLQQIQQLKVQIAQTQIIPAMNQQALIAAGSNDPVTQAKAQYKASLIQLQAANANYQAEYNAELKAVADAQKELDDFLKSWDGHARGSQLAIIQKLESALGAAKSNVNKTGTDPFKQMAELQKEQSDLAQANAEEQLKEAQYSASIAGIRNATSLAQAQLVGLLGQEQRYSHGKLKNDEKLAELQQQEILLRAQIRDDQEADKESLYDMRAAIDKVHGDEVGAAQQGVIKARAAYNHAVKEYKKNSKQARDAMGQLITAEGAYQDAILAQINSSLDLQIAQLTARGKAGDLAQASNLKVQEAMNALREYLHKGGKKGTSEYNKLQGDIASAQRAAFDQQLQDQLDTLDFQRETYQITSAQEIASLQLILKNKQLTLQEQRDITLKIKNLQESIREQLTQGGLNIPSNIKLPTAYDVRRSLGAGFGGNATQVNTINNNQQVTINNNVPNEAVAASIANSVIDLINQQTSMGLRASSSTPRTVQTR